MRIVAMGLPIAAACCLESAAADAPRLRFDDASILAASGAAAEGGASVMDGDGDESRPSA